MLMLIWKNISRRRMQSVLTISITLLTVMVFVMVMGVLQTMSTGLELSRERLGADAVLLPKDAGTSGNDLLFTAVPENIYMPAEVLEQAKELEGIAAMSPQFYAQTLDESCCEKGSETRIVGYDAETDFILAAFMEDGISPQLGEKELILGGNHSSYAGVEIFMVLSKMFNIEGILQPSGTGMDDTIFMSMEAARNLCATNSVLKDDWQDKDPGDYISVVMIKLEEGVDPDEFAHQVEDSGIEAKCLVTGDTIAALQRQLNTTMKVLVGLWLASMLIAVLALVGRFSALAKERKKEIGLLRAIGVGRAKVFGLVIGEACTMAVIGGVLGSAAALFCMEPVIEMLRVDFTLSPSVWTQSMALSCAAMGVLLAAVLGFLSALVPAARSAALDPQTAITQGEVN